MWNSIRTRLTITFLALTIGPLLVTGIILAQRIFTADQSLAYNLQTQAAQDASDKLETPLREITSSLVDLASEVRTAQFVYGDDNLAKQRLEMNISLTRAITTGPSRDAFEELALLNGEGMEWVVLTHEENMPESELSDRKDLDEYLVPKTTRFTYYSPVQFDSTTGKPLITIAFPIFRGTELKVVLVAKVRFEAIGELLKAISVGEDQTIYITDGNGSLLAHQDPTIQLQSSKIALPTQANTQTGLNGENVILATNEILFGDQSIYLVAEKPVAKALTLSRNTRITIAILVVASILVASLFGFLAIRQIVVPIEELADTAENITAGDLTLRANVQRRDEIGALGTAFNAMTSQLREFIGSLEQRVEERTAELEHRSAELEIANRRNQQRATQFEAIAQVANAIASIRTLGELLPKITQLISEQFNFYHVGIFLNDASNQYATLSAANSEGGQRMLARKHQLKIGEQGIVGNVASTGKPRIALNVGEDAVFFNNPDLPDTHSEMALPLTVSGKIVGVLDVQSTERAAFDQDDLQILSILADQVSLAIENARLFEESSKSITEAEALYKQYLRQAWERMPKEHRLKGYHYSAIGAAPIEYLNETQKDKYDDQSRRPGISVPIMLRGESIGTLAIQVPEVGQVNEDQMDLIRAVAERVAISAENARLFEETNRRAERERLVTDITAKIRSTNDPEAMIQTALNELKTALGATKVQLVPHTLQESKTTPMPDTPPNPPGKSKKTKKDNKRKK